MTEEQVLAKLHDIVSAKPLGLWPLAIGWYFVGFILLSLLIFTGLWGYRWYQHGKPKREALSLLRDCQSAYDGNPIAAAVFISELLRRVALAYYPAVQVASLQGSDWIAFLKRESPALSFRDLETCLTELPYQKTSTALSNKISQLFSEAAAWIKQRTKPCFN